MISKIAIFLISILLCFICSFITVQLASKLDTSYLPILMLLVIFFFIISIPFIKAYTGSDKVDYLEIIYPIGLLFLLNYGLRTIYVLIYPFSYEIPIHPDILDYKILKISLLFLDIGYLCLLLGYYCSIPKKLAAIIPSFLMEEYPRDNQQIKIIIVFLFGLSIIIYGASLGDLSMGALGPNKTVEENSTHDYIRHFSLYTWYALGLALFMEIYKQNGSAKITIIFLSVFLFTYTFISGSKGRFLSIGLIFLLWINYRQVRINIRRYIFIFVPVIISLIVIFAWINNYRAVYRNNFERSLPTWGNVTKSISFTYRGFSSLSLKEYLELGLGIMMDRQHSIDGLCAIIAQTPNPHQYLYGRDFLWIIPCALIPRGIWASKPHLYDVDIFDVDYWHVGKGSCAGPPFIGDLYMNFGLPGILVGMFIVGIILRFLYIYFVENTHMSSPGLFYYCFIYIMLLRIISEASVGDLSDVIKTSIFYMAPVHLFMKKSRLMFITVTLLIGSYAFWKFIGMRIIG